VQNIVIGWTSSYLDVIRSKEISRLKNELFDAMRNYQQVTGQLNILFGSDNETEYELTDNLYYQSQNFNGDTVINFFSSQSNFLRISEIQVEQSKSLLSLAEKNSLPDLISLFKINQLGNGLINSWV
jgi:hypothetical protein